MDLSCQSAPEWVMKLSMQSLTPSPTMPTLWSGRNELAIFSSMLRKADISQPLPSGLQSEVVLNKKLCCLQKFCGCASKAHSSRSVFHCWSPWQRLQFPRAHMPNLWPQTKHRGLEWGEENDLVVWADCVLWVQHRRRSGKEGSEIQWPITWLWG